MPEVIQPPTSREERLQRVVARGKRLRLFRSLRWAAAATATVAIVAIAGGSVLLSQPDRTDTAGTLTSPGVTDESSPGPTEAADPVEATPEAAAPTGGLEGIVAEGILPLVKAQGWREALGEDHLPFATLEISYDRASAERAWRENVPSDLARAHGMPETPGIYGVLDDVDYETHAVVVWSTGESGSCPEWLADVRVRNGQVETESRIAAQVRGEEPIVCTADYSPYRMLLAVPRDRLPGPGDLPREQYRDDQDPGEADWPWLLVREYPS